MRSKAGKAKAVAAARLLNQGRIAKRLKDASGVPAHVVGDGQDKAGCELTQGRSGTREGWRIGEELAAREQHVELSGALEHIAVPLLLDLGDMVGHAPEHLVHGFSRAAVLRHAEHSAASST